MNHHDDIFKMLTFSFRQFRSSERMRRRKNSLLKLLKQRVVLRSTKRCHDQ